MDRKEAADLLHSSELGDPRDHHGKKVLVIGSGNTAGDVAVSLAAAGADVALSVRTPTAILPRRPGGKCIDHRNPMFLLRLPALFREAQIRWLVNRHGAFIGTAPGPGRSIWNTRVTVNDDLAGLLHSGRIRILDHAAAPSRDAVPDLVVECTGWDTDLSFLASVMPGGAGRPWISARGNIAIIGVPVVLGGTPPVLEAQARLAIHVFHERLAGRPVDFDTAVLRDLSVPGRLPIVDYMRHLRDIARVLGDGPRFSSPFETVTPRHMGGPTGEATAALAGD